MKNTVKILSALALGALAAVSCDLQPDINKVPAFDQADACVGFEESTLTVQEDVNILAIPVSIATINPIETRVTYELIDSTGKGMAVLGTDFEFVDPTLTLNFTDNWTDSIRVKIIQHKGEYTGNLKFGIRLSASPDVPICADSTIFVTIKDLDHPLSDIIGNWTVTAESGWYGTEQETSVWTGEDDDLTKIWIWRLTPYCYMYVYGIVSGEEGSRIIKITCGQTYYNYYDWVLNWMDESWNDGSTGVITLTQQADGSFVSDKGVALPVYDHTSGEIAGYYDIFFPGIVWEKQ